IFAVCVLAAGAAVYICCIWDFASFGRGTPMPIDAPERLVIRGPYRYTRNPMYVSVLAVILGWAIFFGAVFLIVYGVVVAVCFHLFIVFYEEPHLRRKFERDYEQYCSRVGRWLPKFKG
ncbi:MAG: isoprenylcysteine carboxylmethyltransferase family protein, partial [Deltaproteobacteria bacterium]|nr:isoprenylcysteine carboxylmethyltransferase family protein [Deltaproteobacteria bacterium]